MSTQEAAANAGDALCFESAVRLTELLAAREVSAEELARAHLARLVALEPKLHAFTEVLFDEAIAAARRSDEERRRGEVRGPLHGLPMTVKESLDFEGRASTLGLEKRRRALAPRDAVIVEVMRRAGAVIVGRTNVSQLLLFHESRNPLFGQTANPWSLAHCAGGSSGGEASAIAAGCSPLGVGTDVGGSIRVPAHFCGIAGLKPTLDRWSNLGSNTALVGQEAVRSQLGPMARSAKDLALAMRAVDARAMSELDGRVPPLAFVDPKEIDVAKLAVGVFTEDGLVPPSLSVARAVEIAASALRDAGARVVPVELPGLDDAVYDYFAALSADGGQTAIRALEGTEIDPSLRSLTMLARIPDPARRALAAGMLALGERRVARFLSVFGSKSVAEYWRLTGRLRAARFAIERTMREAKLDVLICPAHATPALPHGGSRDFVIAGSSSILFNVTQLPAGVVPVTRVSSSEAARPRPGRLDRLEKQAARVDAESAGLPVGVQVVGRAWEESKVLAAMIAIEERAGASPDFPRRPLALA